MLWPSVGSEQTVVLNTVVLNTGIMLRDQVMTVTADWIRVFVAQIAGRFQTTVVHTYDALDITAVARIVFESSGHSCSQPSDVSHRWDFERAYFLCIQRLHF